MVKSIGEDTAGETPKTIEEIPANDAENGSQNKTSEDKRIAELQSELESERKKNAELLHNMKYLRADIVNLQRQTDRMLIDVRNQAKSSLILEIISILEDLDRAMAVSTSSDFKSVLEGLKLLRANVESKLSREDVNRIAVEKGSKLNPKLHDAVSFKETTDQEDGSILSVISYGYTLGDIVIKPALVEVARNIRNNDEIDSALKEENESSVNP